MEFALRAEKAATSAKSDRIQTGKDVIVTGQNKQVAETKAQESAISSDEAKAARDSIVQDANEVRHNTQQVADNAASVASNTTLVQRKAEQVAQNTQTVTTKTQQVSENAQAVAANTQAVTLMRDEVVAKTSMAQAAADTATQKAASAAEHDAAAAEYARQAQEAAQATAGALIDGGAADLSTGVYPQPVQVSGTARPTFWKVTKGGTVGGVDYGVGDTLIYTVAGSGSYYKIDNTESVTSVQGEKGAVTLTPEKIGADPAGTASAGMQQHISAPDPHSQYAKKTDVDPKGSAEKNVAAHESKLGAHNINGVSGLQEALASKTTDGVDIFRNNGMPQSLNAAVRPGFYAYRNTSDGNPDPEYYGHILVVSSGQELGVGTWLQQIAFSHSGKCFTRRSVNNSEFTPWYTLYTSNNVPTRTDLGFGDSVTRNAGSSEGQLLYQGCDFSDHDWASGKGFGIASNVMGGNYYTWLRLQRRIDSAPGKGLGCNIGVSYDGSLAGELAYSPFTWAEAGKIYFVRTTRNTTVDSNGFIKRASPIARLYGDEISAKRDSEYSISGCAAINHEANGVNAMRESMGIYRVTGSLGFATDGWYIETPADANGNKLLFVEYEQYHNGDILIKTFSPDYSTGRCMAGEPKDIPEGRWIDLRLSMPITEN